MNVSNRTIALLGLTLLILALVAVIADDGDAANRRAYVKAVICEVFGPRCNEAVSVAKCETGGTLSPWARGSAGERGLFQVHPIHFGWLNERRLYEPAYNARAAYRLSRGGRDWSHWTCRP